MTVSKTLSEILNTKFQTKLNTILTNFVIDSSKDVCEEKQDFIFSGCEEKILYLVEETLDKINSNSKARKSLVFVEHIEEHLNQMGLSEENVMCKICERTIDEIYVGV